VDTVLKSQTQSGHADIQKLLLVYDNRLHPKFASDRKALRLQLFWVFSTNYDFWVPLHGKHFGCDPINIEDVGQSRMFLRPAVAIDNQGVPPSNLGQPYLGGHIQRGRINLGRLLRLGLVLVKSDRLLKPLDVSMGHGGSELNVQVIRECPPT
jgi:hypothetical protein